ncbi:hypothetical protein J6590_009177 [Homalodisca vitripennis]|nr:hypothetical protein J6590_009177 [Homalodisca vitripennis]
MCLNFDLKSQNDRPSVRILLRKEPRRKCDYRGHEASSINRVQIRNDRPSVRILLRKEPRRKCDYRGQEASSITEVRIRAKEELWRDRPENG